SLHWVSGDAAQHPLLADLGPEPLESGFDADYLTARARARREAAKQCLMNQKIVVGVGNIYANEALFRAGINPRRAAGRISRARYDALAPAMRDVLDAAVTDGG